MPISSQGFRQSPSSPQRCSPYPRHHPTSGVLQALLLHEAGRHSPRAYMLLSKVIATCNCRILQPSLVLADIAIPFIWWHFLLAVDFRAVNALRNATFAHDVARRGTAPRLKLNRNQAFLSLLAAWHSQQWATRNRRLCAPPFVRAFSHGLNPSTLRCRGGRISSATDSSRRAASLGKVIGRQYRLHSTTFHCRQPLTVYVSFLNVKIHQ